MVLLWYGKVRESAVSKIQILPDYSPPLASVRKWSPTAKCISQEMEAENFQFALGIPRCWSLQNGMGIIEDVVTELHLWGQNNTVIVVGVGEQSHSARGKTTQSQWWWQDNTVKVVG